MTSVQAKPGKPSQQYGCLRAPGIGKGQKKFAITVEKRVQLTHNVFVITFKLPDADLPLGTGPSEHIYLHAKVPIPNSTKTNDIKRMYCVVSPPERKGTFDLLFKVYRPNAQHPKGGMMSQYLEKVEVGSTLWVQGPLNLCHYPQAGTIQVFEFTPWRIRTIGMCIGGSGITGVFTLLKAIAENPYDETTVSMIYANTTEEDILLKDELDQIAANCPRIKITYVVTKPSPTWTGLTGYITRDMIRQYLPPPGDGVFMWSIGPPPMDEMVIKYYSELGYRKSRTMVAMYSYIFRLIFAAMCCGCSN